MAKKKKNGLHIGNYVIRPLGLTIIGLLLVALIVVGTLIIARSIRRRSRPERAGTDASGDHADADADCRVRRNACGQRDAHAVALAFSHAGAALCHHPLSGRDRGAAKRAQRRAHGDQL